MSDPNPPFQPPDWQPAPPANPYSPVEYPEYPPVSPPAAPPYSPYPSYPPPAPSYPSPYSGYQPPAHPAYPAYDPYRAAPHQGTNGMAIAALVTSLTGPLTCGVSAIVGVILGFIAMQQTKQTGQEGHGLALAGVIIGAVEIVGFVLYLVFIVILAASTS